MVGLNTEFPEEGDDPINFAARRRLKFRSGWGREALLELLAERTSIPQILVFN